MNTHENTVSVIIPTYKRPEELKRCLASLTEQTYNNIEVVIINDSGRCYDKNNNIKSIVKSYKDLLNINYIENQNSIGGAKSRNIGLRVATGAYICFLDDDDEFMANKIELQLNYLKYNPCFQAVYCGYHIYNKSHLVETKIYIDEGDLSLKILMLENGISAGSTLMISKSAVERIEGFDESFKRHQDWEFMLRFFCYFELGVIQRPLVKIHMDDNNNRHNVEAVESSKIKLLEKYGYIIDTFELKIKNKIYFKNYYELCKFFLYRKMYLKALQYYKLATNYDRASLKMKVKLFGFMIDSYLPFYRKFSQFKQLLFRLL
jgi:glycosyltransferase involved in cell wall biosynthesis